MINILAKIFIKNNDDILNPKVRKDYGVLAGSVGIMNNVFLFVIKFIAGVLTGAISITADAFNNLSDAASSIVTLIGFYMAGKPADNDHPYGHGRIEYVSGLIVAIIIIVMGLELLKSSVEKIINPEAVNFSALTGAILVVSILVKLWMTSYNFYLAKKLDAAAMEATAIDSRNDCIATGAVLICLIIGKFTGLNIDGYAGGAVALFVLYSGYDTAKGILNPILGEAPNYEFIKELENKILECDGIMGVHDIIVHDYGPGRTMVSLHAEIYNNISVTEAHEIIDKAENIIKKELNCDICIHMDPIATDDKRINELKKITTNAALAINKELGIHDFRVAECNDEIMITFDVSAPFNLKMTDDEIKLGVCSNMQQLSDKFNVVIEDVDRICQ
ncbi:MAG: cation diffusion facilitator family transporter [Lachnospirales bacterium]